MKKHYAQLEFRFRLFTNGDVILASDDLDWDWNK